MNRIRLLSVLAFLFALTGLVGCGDGGSGVEPKGPTDGPKAVVKTPAGAGVPGGKTGTQ